MGLMNSMQTANSYTENGALTNSSTLNANLDLFSRIGAMRGKNATGLFTRAWSEDRELATRILLWAGDIRGGAGERQIFKDLIKLVVQYLGKDNINTQALFDTIVELSRFDVLFTFVDTELEQEMFKYYTNALVSGDKSKLAAKWAPREKSANKAIAKKFRQYLGFTAKEYRKALVNSSETVEQLMCAKRFSEIKYEQVPSVAAARYQRAFYRNDEARYDEYRRNLVSGETTINASTLFPYDVIKSLRNGDSDIASAQWKALPDYLNGNDENILPVVDVSGSMDIPVSGGTTAMDVSISLGLYLSERIQGKFKDHFVTFSERPEVQVVKGQTLYERYNSLRRASWGYSTNLVGTFKAILDVAVRDKLPQSEMPNKVLIITDMEFDCGTQGSTNFQDITNMYKSAGYELPQLVYWNVNSRSDSNYPVQKDDIGVALVSGLSPAIVKSVLGGVVLTPMDVMFDTVNVERYTPTFMK